MVTNEEKDEEATSCNKDCNKKDQNSTERGKSDAHKSVAKELYRDKTPNGSKLKQCKKRKKKQVRNSHQEHTTVLSTTRSGGSDSMESCRWR